MHGIYAMGSPPTTYAGSIPQIEWRCKCHPGRVAGSATRTGSRLCDEIPRPCYRLSSFLHPEVAGKLAVLRSKGRRLELISETLSLVNKDRGSAP